MRPRALFALTAVAASAAACATVQPPSPAAEPPAGAAAPAPVEGRDWFHHADADAGRLVYGAAESDDLKLGFECRRGSGRLEVLSLAPKGAKAEIVLESGGETARLPARSEPSQLDDGVLLTAGSATAAPVLQRFRRLGWVALWRDGDREAYAPHPGSAADIERFFVFCG